MNIIKNKTTSLYALTERIIFWIRHQNYFRANIMLIEWTKEFTAYVQLLLSPENTGISVDSDFIISTLQDILNSQNNDDYLSIADNLEFNVLDIYRYIIGEIANNLEPLCEQNSDIALFDSLSGLKNVTVTQNGLSISLHSNIRPIGQALSLCSEYYNPDTDGYIVFGLGMGYHVIELSKMCSDSVPIKVYECNDYIIDKATSQQYFTDNTNENITIIHDPELREFSNAVSKAENETLIVHSPSIKLVKNASLRKKLNEIFIHESSVRNQICEMNSNFKKNIVNCDYYVDELQDEFKDKNVFLIAAGPSLDSNISLLKNKPKDSIILAVGSVYRKLINLQIVPDYVVFLDCKSKLFSQVDGLVSLDTPIIIASTACAKIGSRCNGKKYLVCQNGLSEAEKYAAENNCNLYESGGSVSTIAFDIAVKLGAKKIITMGLDLSLKDGKMHADGSGTQMINKTDNSYISIPGYFGDTVVTTPNMEIYRQWFINYISKNEATLPELINSTEGGCNIEGMKNESLANVIARL